MSTTDDLINMEDKDLLNLIVCNPEVYNEIFARLNRGKKASKMISKMFGQDQKLDKFIIELQRDENDG